MRDVVVYTSDTCGYCHAVKQYLKEKNVHYTEKNISKSPEARRELIRMGFMGVPIILVGNETVVGFDRSRLDQLL